MLMQVINTIKGHKMFCTVLLYIALACLAFVLVDGFIEYLNGREA